MKEGKWHPLTERLSRWARIRLLRVLIEEMNRKEIAEECDITIQAISNWINKENSHPSNKTSKVLLKLALDNDSSKVKKIIRNDIKRYFDELKEAGIGILNHEEELFVRKN